jgi:multidrug efflux pump subunit AcrA (membrane-fusion protein)
MITLEQPTRTPAQPRPGDGLVAPAPALPPLVPHRRSPRRRRLLLLPIVALLIGAVVFVLLSGGRPDPAASGGAAATESVAPPKLTARGEVTPIGQARVGTLSGGVVQQLSVRVGDPIGEQQELARIKSGAGIEILAAPWRGTVIGIPIHVGDTVTPGTTVAVVGDLSRLQVETTDVDEFLIGGIQPGQPIIATIDALDRRELRGYVRTVSLYVQKNEDGDDHYPVVIDFVGSTAALRPGMTARVTFLDESADPR